MNIDLNDMLVFLTVAEHGSFTKAADVIGVPKSNISRKISRLEQHLGTRLLERTTRALHLTEIGQVYVEHCRRIQEEVLHANACVENLSATPQGLLRICTSVTVGQELLAKQLAQFCLQYPQITLDTRLVNRRVDIIDEGYDLAIRVGHLDDSSLIAKKLGEIELYLYASPSYLQTCVEQQVDIDELADLAQHQCLFMSAMGEKPRWQLNCAENSDSQYIDIAPVLISDDFHTLRQCATDGMGIAMLPDYLAQQAVADKKMVRVLDKWVGRSVDVFAIYPSHKSVTPKLRVMLDFLESNLLK